MTGNANVKTLPRSDRAGGAEPSEACSAQAATVIDVDRKLECLAVALEIQGELESVGDPDVAALHATRSLLQFASCDRVLLLWRGATETQIRIVADTAASSMAEDRDEMRLIEAAGEEISARDCVTTWPPKSPTDRFATMAVGQWSRAASWDRLIALPLAGTGGQSGVVFMLDFDPKWTLASAPLTVIGDALGIRLSGIESRRAGRFERGIARLRELTSGRRKTAWLVGAVLLLAAMMYPAVYRVAADFELQPVTRRFVAVGFDGPLRSAHVRPGDTVSSGQVLATIDSRELDYQIAGALAERRQAKQERMRMMAEKDFAGAKLATLEEDRIEQQLELMYFERSHLEIRSPIDGMVVSGDWKQSEGMPMTRGETLFEIAPLGRMRVEVAIAEDDIVLVRTGQQVDFHLHAMPERRLVGSIDRVHPRAELREQQNVFIADVLVSDPEHLLRPGMRGRAKIGTVRRPLGWNLFHKPYYAAIDLLGW